MNECEAKIAETKRLEWKQSQLLTNPKNWLLAALVILVLGGIYWLGHQQLADFLAFIADRERFSAYIHSFGLLGPVVLILLQIAQVLLAVFPGYASIVGAGYIYGLPLGYLLNLGSIVLASQLAFGIARYLGRPVVVRLAPAELIDRWDGVARRHGFPFFLTAFFLPIFPADTMNYVGGLTAISGKKFFVASLLGRAPACLFLTAMGAYSTELAALGLPSWTWLLIALFCIALYIGWQILFERLKPDYLKISNPSQNSPTLPPKETSMEITEDIKIFVSPRPEVETVQLEKESGIPEVTDHFIELPQTTLHYVRCGDGPPLIMVPATVSRVENWLALVKFMAKHFTVYFFELPGHGKSTPFSEPFTTRLVAETVESFIDALGYERVSLMGFSFGGILAMKSLYLLKDRIDKVILVAPALSKRAITFSPLRLRAAGVFVGAMRNAALRDGFLSLIKSRQIRPLAGKVLRRAFKVDQGIDMDEVFEKISATTCEVLAYQFTELMELELPNLESPLPHPCYFAMSIYDTMLDYQTTVEVARKQFTQLQVKELYLPYHQPPRPFTYEEIETQFGSLLETLVSAG